MTEWGMAGEVSNVAALFGAPAPAAMGAGATAGPTAIPLAGGPADGPARSGDTGVGPVLALAW